MPLRPNPAITAARQKLLDLLDTQPIWNEAVLREEAGLSPTTFHRAMEQLLQDGEAVVSVAPDGKQVTMYRRAPPRVPVAPSTAPLAPQPSRVLAQLRAFPDTSQSLAARLALTLSEVMAALELLEARGLVTRRYVGMLAIFRVTEGVGPASPLSDSPKKS